MDIVSSWIIGIATLLVAIYIGRLLYRIFSRKDNLWFITNGYTHIRNLKGEEALKRSAFSVWTKGDKIKLGSEEWHGDLQAYIEYKDKEHLL